MLSGKFKKSWPITNIPGLLFMLTFILCVEHISYKLLIIGDNQRNFLKIWQQIWPLRLWFSMIAGQVVSILNGI
jgi:hypothetical protein